MKIQTINSGDGSWSDQTDPQSRIRLDVNGVWYEVQDIGDGLKISSEHKLVVEPRVSNSISVFVRKR